MLHGRQVGLVGAAHVDRVGEVLVELAGVGGEPVAALPQVLRHLRPVDRVPLGRHLVHRLVDRGVGHLRHELAGDLLVYRPLDARQQPARDVVVVRGQPLDPLRVLARVAHEARDHPAHHAHRLALVAREGLVGVLRQRHPDGPAAFEARPAPLPLVAVPVADHQVEQARLEEGTSVDLVLRPVLLPLLPEVERRDDLGDVPRAGPEVLVEGSDRAAERRAELAERGIVRHHHQPRAVERDADRLRERADDHRRGRVGGRGLVDRDGSQLAVLPLLRQHALGVLLELAERVAAAVGRLHRQPFRLESPDLAQRRESSRLGLQVEHGQLDRRRPGLAVTLAEPEAPVAAPVELLARHDRLRRGRHCTGRRRLGRLAERGSGRCYGRDQAAEDYRPSMHGSSSNGPDSLRTGSSCRAGAGSKCRSARPC